MAAVRRSKKENTDTTTVEQVKINDTPGSPNKPQDYPATPGKVVTISSNPQREYVAAGLSGQSAWYINYPRALPWPIDDVTTDFGDDLYDRMALDPIIAQVLSVLKTGIIEEGIILTSAVSDIADANSAVAGEILAASKEMFANLDTDIDALLWNMLDGLHLGNKVAELVFDYVETKDKVRLDITQIHVKSRKSLAFVVDAYGNIIGLTARIPGIGAPVLQSNFIDPEYVPNILPREKFWVFTSRQQDQDPRGTSILRPAYEFWNIKHQIMREYLKYLTQFASASLFATTPEGAEVTPEVDATTRIPTGNHVNPWEVLRTALEQFRNGSVMVAPYDTQLKELFSQGDGTAFIRALELITKEVVASILGQTLASQEGQHQSRAAAATHQDILSSIIRQMKRTLCRSIRSDIIIPWVRRNWGADKVAYAPFLSLGETETPNLPQLMTAVANLFTSGFISPSQLEGLDGLLNLNQRTPEEYDEMNSKFKAGLMNPRGVKTTPDMPPANEGEQNNAG